MYLFLQEDLDALEERIQELGARILAVGKEMGQSTQVGAESWHDNFDFEQGQRDHAMLSQRLTNLRYISLNAAVVIPEDSDEVGIGRIVEIEDESGDVQIFKIASFMILRERGEAISYEAPLAQLLIGAKAGEVRHGKVAGRERSFKVLRVA